MARQEIDLTTPQPNGKMGEPTKAAWEKVNDMTEELYDGLDSSTIISYGESAQSFSVTAGGANIITRSFLAKSDKAIVSFGGTFRAAPSSTGSIRLLVNGSQVSQLLVSNTLYATSGRTVVISGLTVGSMVEVRVYAIATSGTTIDVYGDPTDKFSLCISR